MAPLPPIQMLRHAAACGSRRRFLPSRNNFVHQLQKRSLATDSTRPLYAQPHRFVAGVTSQQLDESQATKAWYAANFPDYLDEPDTIIIGEEEEEAAAQEAAEAEEEEENPSIIKLPEHLTKRNIRPMVAYLRDREREEGSRACYKLRNPGVNDPNFPLIPGIIHGSDPTKNIVSGEPYSKVLVKTPWFEIQRELDRYHHGITGSFENRVYALTVFPGDEANLDHHRGRQPKDRTTYKLDDDTMTVIETPGPKPPVPPPRTPVEGMENILVIPADLQMHPVSHSSYCLNYIRYHPSKPIKIPIRNVNEEESPAIKRGGFLCYVNRFVECLIEDGAPIPECIQLECTGLRAKDVVRRDRLIIPEGVTIHPRVPKDYLMGTVLGVRGAQVAVAGEEQEGGENEVGGS